MRFIGFPLNKNDIDRISYAIIIEPLKFSTKILLILSYLQKRCIRNTECSTSLESERNDSLYKTHSKNVHISDLLNLTYYKC